MIRRVGIKPFITGFCTKEEAEEFTRKYEEKYCLNPKEFDYDHLRSCREREFHWKSNE